MNKEIKKVFEAAEGLALNVPDKGETWLKGIDDAQAAQRAAAKAKEDATTEAAFNKACDDEAHARDREAFYRRQLEHLEYSPRMDEAVYYGHVDAVKRAVESAAATFRRTAEKAIDDITAAKEAYLEVTADADAALTALDNAANVLQSQYRYRVHTYIDRPAMKIEDRSEWMRHAIRYRGGSDSAYRLVARDGGDWNKKVCAAWQATERAQK